MDGSSHKSVTTTHESITTTTTRWTSWHIVIDILYINVDGSSHESDEDHDNYEDIDEENDSDNNTNEKNKRKIGLSINAIIKKL
jgi:hypothetical protein